MLYGVEQYSSNGDTHWKFIMMEGIGQLVPGWKTQLPNKQNNKQK